MRYAQTTYIDFASGAGRKAPLVEANRLSRSAPLDREMCRRAKLEGKPHRPKVERTSHKAAK
ncbi:MAG: hypothetical protein IKJ37_17995 [Kiritimatiellae bacterium]|nr:hypothetical protein [Kiritimatiellia bacterium]